MMSLIGHQPVLWVNVKTLLASGPYSESNMESWDNALVNACAEYPNMRVFNWAAIAKPTWFTSDGIHYNSPGSAPRAAAIADALATAFPASTGPVDSHIAPAGRRAQANAAQSPAANCVVDEGANWQLPTFQY